MSLTPLEPWIAHKLGQPQFERAALEAFQLAQLRTTLAWVRARSPFYQRHLAAAPADLASLADLARFPFTTAADLRAAPLQFVCVSQDAIARVVTLDTSGTSGPPKRLYFTSADQELTIDFFQVGMSTFTAAGDRVLILLPGETPGSVGDLLAEALRRLGAVPIKHGPVRDPAQTLAVAAQEQITVMVGVPVHVLRLVRQAPAAAPRLRLKSVLLTTDHVPRAITQAVEQAWGCRVYNHYGLTETGLGGGVDCSERRGYHLREADLYVEVVDPATGAPLAPGELGEVVVTTLTRTGLPLLRYRTGDLGRFLPGPCPCGTALHTLAHITTRVAGRVSLGAAPQLSMADLDEAVFALDGVLDFSAEVGDVGRQRWLTLAVWATRPSDQALTAAVTQAVLTIPAVRRACQAGVLAPPVVQLAAGPPNPPGAAKRTIRLVPEP